MSECDVLVVGAGCGGIAAAIAAARRGRSVVLTEPTRWIGGQLTSQAVPPDEHPWIEWTGCTALYRSFRQGVRDRYAAAENLSPSARSQTQLNPGQAWVSRLSAEPRIIHQTLQDLLAPYLAQGTIRLLLGHAPISVEADGDNLQSVSFRDDQGIVVTIRAAYVLEATEEGELLELAGAESVIGAESVAQTGELHALPGDPDPMDQQAITWCAALEHRPGEDHRIDKPTEYAKWLAYRADHWPGPQLGWTTQMPETGEPLTRPLFAEGTQDLWTFRRIRYGQHYVPTLSDLTLVNWPQADYWLAPLVGVSPEQRAAAMADARSLTLSFVYWLQHDAPRPDGDTGYPELRLAGEPLGTEDGLAQLPYIREARRIRAQFTVLEQHLGVEARPGATSAEPFVDSVGVGSYRIDLHPSTGQRPYLDIANFPFQIPLGALLPERVSNLIAAGKSVGVTHITNGCYRLHPVEWNIGEAAGELAAWSLNNNTTPTAVRSDPDSLRNFQEHLVRAGFVLEWPEECRSVQR